jgi:hypothetical protein
LLKDSGDIKGTEDPNKHSNKLLSLYQKLVKKVYAETRTDSGSQATHILEKLDLKEKPKVENDFKADEKLPKKIREKAQKTTVMSMHQKESIELKNKKITNYKSLFDLAYQNNNFVTFPFIAEANKDFRIDIEEIQKSKIVVTNDAHKSSAEHHGNKLYL